MLFEFSCTGSLLLCAGLSLVVTRRLLVAAASLVAEHGLSAAGPVAVVRGLSCPTACGIFLGRGCTHMLSALAGGVFTFGLLRKSSWRLVLKPASSIGLCDLGQFAYTQCLTPSVEMWVKTVSV